MKSFCPEMFYRLTEWMTINLSLFCPVVVIVLEVSKDCTVTPKKDIKMAGLAFLAVKRMILLTGRFKVFLKETWLLEVSDFPGCD